MKYKKANQTELLQTITATFFGFYIIGWVLTQYWESDFLYNAWGLSYCIFALIGGVFGLLISKRWGGIKSTIGKIIYSFSIGLLFQFVGQNFANYYILSGQEIYPSFADVGFFGSIFFYITGSILLTKISGVEYVWRQKKYRVVTGIIFICTLSISYFFLLRHVQYDWAHPMLILLDFGYPFGQAIFVSFAFVTFFLTRNILGEIIRKSILLFLLALVLQFLADYWFSIIHAQNMWQPGNLNDVMYMTAYFFMASAIISLGKIDIKNTHD